MALGVNVSAALSGLKANLGSFFGAAAEPATAAGAADVEGAAGDGVGDGAGLLDCEADTSVGDGAGLLDCGADTVSGTVIELAEGVSFRGGAGGGWNVSGRFVSLSPEDDDGACEPDTRGGLVCSAVDTE